MTTQIDADFTHFVPLHLGSNLLVFILKVKHNVIYALSETFMSKKHPATQEEKKDCRFTLKHSK